MDQTQKDNLNFILDHLKENIDNPQWLSKALVSLSTFLIHTSPQIAQAQFEENAAALKHMDTIGDKKISVAEADKRAMNETFNKYKQNLLEREGVMETINALKKRIDFLTVEYKNTP